MSIQRPKGTQDHLPSGSPKLTTDTQAAAFDYVQRVAQQVLVRGGAEFIATPMFEEAEVVQRGVGGSTDIVRKEMFRVHYFGDHGDYVLRPEGTASIMRAYLQNGLKQLPSPLKLWTHGPMFRAENVQKGRLRQFHQIDYECIGSTEAVADAEAIALMWQVVQGLGLQGASIRLGSIGDYADREAYNAYLRQTFGQFEARLSDDSKDRLERNPMRILDSKDKGDQDLIAELQVRPMLDFLGEEAAEHFEQVQHYLQVWNIPYEIDPSIVRGLDYYRRTAWELHHSGVGAKSALGGGGRYDGLAQELGSKTEVAGIGWAFGIERVLLAMEAEGIAIPAAPPPALYIAAMDEENIALTAALAMQARAVAGADFSYRTRKPGQAFKEADRKGARFAAVIGSEEAAQRILSLKNMQTGEHQQVPFDALADALADASK